MKPELLTGEPVPWASPAVRSRVNELIQQHQEHETETVVAAVQKVSTEQIQRLDQQGLGLYAGSNVQSPRVQAAHLGQLSVRPALGWPGEKVQPALEGIEALEIIAMQQLRRAFNADFAEGRFLTATLANLAMYTALTEPGDTIAVLPLEAGGHASHMGVGTAGVRGLISASVPYDPSGLDVSHRELLDFVETVRPRLILVGGSVIQFPTDLAPLREAADRVSAKLVFDASHVAGLIAAQVFPNPLDEGVDLVTFSTYKTLAGPAGGASVTNSPEIAERVSHAWYPMLSSNYDAARLGPLAIATSEAIEQVPSWAQETIELGQLLGAELLSLGLSLQGASRGITETHQVVIDVRQYGGGLAVMRRLETQNIFTGTCRLAQQASSEAPGGIRIGTQEIVRLGATAEHVRSLAELLALSIRGGVSSVTADDIRKSFRVDIWGRDLL